ncbi:TonB-dependent receptor domain-containing protein [Lewinella sp. JB7]|uniref:TonB-dependent receptor n=1 Tax=Lewinella sp. JB7 TaxID=2962887 RepID=UPI0020C9EA60|nr:TonB-dependent receptor [Lewinella sp. JB7]MCP9237118.1 TonB-dependent receptor [Lewinella sp. JB7]
MHATPRYWIIFLLSLSVAALTGQGTSAVLVRVTDAETGVPLPYVNVQIANTVIGGLTDDDGVYTFKFSGRATVMVSAVGYDQRKETVDIVRSDTLSFPLTPVAETLATVTVSSNDASQRLERPLMGVERLSMQEIELLPVALGEVDVFRGLQLVSGVNSAGEASNGLSVRGGTIDQNLVLLDGAPIFTPTHLFGLFSVFTPDAVGSVDLYRANVPARFGGRVTSVVDVRTRNPTSNRLRMQGGIGLVSSRLSVEAPVTKDQRLKVLAAGRVGVNDFVFRAFERLKNTRSKFVDGSLKLRYTPNETDVWTVSTFYSRDVYEIDLLNSFAGVVAASNQYDYATHNVSAEWLRLINESLSLQSRIVRSDHRPRVNFPEVGSDNIVRYDSRIQYTSLRSGLDFQPRPGHRLSGGVQLLRYAIDPGRLDPGTSTNVQAATTAREQAAEVSVYAEEEWKPHPTLTISAGLRYTRFLQLGPGQQRIYPDEDRLDGSYNSVVDYTGGQTMASYGGFEPRLGLSWQFADRSSIKAAYALNRQYLQNIFNSTTPLPSSRWKVADNNIRPQMSQLFSAGLYQVVGEGAVELSLEIYFRRIENLLEYKPGADFFLNPTVESDLLQGEGRAYGAEVGLRKTSGKLTGQINYTYARSQNRVTGSNLLTTINGGRWYNGYFDQPHTVNTNFTVDDGRTHRVSLNLLVQSNRPYSIPNGYLAIDELSVPIFLERNNARLPVYHRLDLSWTIHNAGMTKKRWVGDWTVTLYNLYGRKNAYNIYYQPRTSGQDANVFGNSPLGSYRLTIFGAPIFSLAYSFKFE